MKYALIGCGRIATNHIKAVLNNHLELSAVCDVKPEAMEALLAKHGLEQDTSIRRYTDYKEMVETEKPTLVGIATESGIHAEIALYCIAHGVNVIIEKPMAMSMADADAIVEAAQRNHVKVCACHQNRFNPAVQATRKALEEGRFGKLSHGSIHVRWNRNKGYYDQAPWRGTWAQDGGCLMNQCIHGVDLLRWMMGDEVEEVYAQTAQQFHHYLECEDVGMAVVKFKNGAIGTIEGTTNVYPKNLEETLYLFGETGTVKIGGTSTNNIDVWDFADQRPHPGLRGHDGRHRPGPAALYRCEGRPPSPGDDPGHVSVRGHGTAGEAAAEGCGLHGLYRALLPLTGLNVPQGIEAPVPV